MARADTERRLLETWYGAGKPSLVLRALVPLYRLGFVLKRRWALLRRARGLAGKPIIVVGNITVGGTGKTPLVIRLCELAKAAGLSPGVLSRGYGARITGPWVVRPRANPRKYGDEPVLLARRVRAPVVIARDRVAGARKLFDKGVDVVISDDGLQHYRLPRSLEICVLDGERRLGNGRQLPAGPLREPASRLKSVDHVFVNGNTTAASLQGDELQMRLSPLSLRSLNGGQRVAVEGIDQRLEGLEIHAYAGIGNPQRFFRQLDALGIKATHHPMPDHHPFAKQDFDGIASHSMIIMTEKDAVKCFDLELPNAWYLRVSAVLPDEWEKTFMEKVTALVGAAPSQAEQAGDEAD